MRRTFMLEGAERAMASPMKISRVRHAQNLGVMALMASLLVGCGGGRNPFTQRPISPGGSFSGTVLQSGTVRFPSGVAIDPKSLVVQNSLGGTPLGNSGTFKVQAFGDAQLTMVTGSTGKPLLLSFLGAKQSDVSVHTTAEVLVFYAGYFFMLPHAERQVALDSLSTLPGLNSIEGALTTAITKNPTASSLTDPAVVVAVHNLAVGLAGSSAGGSPASAGLQARVSRLLTVSPAADGRSGITPLFDSTPDGVHFQNSYRRSASVFVDQVSHVALQDTGVPGTQITDGPPDRASAQMISSVSGFNGVLGTINDIVKAYFDPPGKGTSTAATAYTPIYTDSIPLPNRADAKSTRYRIAVVGPGAKAGDESQLTAVEHQAQLDTSTSFFITDVFVPFAASVALGANSLDSGHGPVGDLLKELLPIYGAIPGFNERAADGDVKGVLTLGFTSLASVGAVQDKTFDAILRYVNSSAVGNLKASTAALAFSRVLTGGDLLLGAVDLGAVTGDVARSNRADIYFVDAVPTKVTLTPATSSLMPLATVNLTTTVPGTDAGSGPLVYHYKNTAKYGNLIDGLPGHRDEFDSSLPKVTYVAGATGSSGNTDTVTVTPSIVNGQKRTEVGTASATVSVGPTPTPTPTPGPCPECGSFSGTFLNLHSVPPGTKPESGYIEIKVSPTSKYDVDGHVVPDPSHLSIYVYERSPYSDNNTTYADYFSLPDGTVTRHPGGGSSLVSIQPSNDPTGDKPTGNLEFSADYTTIKGTLYTRGPGGPNGFTGKLPDVFGVSKDGNLPTGLARRPSLAKNIGRR